MNALLRHPDSACPAVTGIEAGVAHAADGGLALTYTLAGQLAALRIPEPGLARHRDGLWRHTCFEAFIGTPDGPAYLEFNFSPSGEWAAYTFRAYREGAVLELDAPPEVVVDHRPDRLRLTATIARRYLPGSGRLRLGLSAVVEDTAGGLSYWALRHPPGRADFHHTDGFAIELEPA